MCLVAEIQSAHLALPFNQRYPLTMNARIATLMVHTSPLDQPGIGDAGGMNIYVAESAERMAAGSWLPTDEPHFR